MKLNFKKEDTISDWKIRIQHAKIRERFTDEDKTRALDWITCAVGEKLGHNKELIDKETKSGYALLKFGSEFYKAVKVSNISKAKRIYDEIQTIIINGRLK